MSRLVTVALPYVIVFCASLICVSAQSNTDVRPRFDIADVHVSAPNDAVAAIPNMQGGVVRDGVYKIQTATMVDLVKTAYSVEADAVVGVMAFADALRGMPAAQQYLGTGMVVDQTGLRGEWDFDFTYSQKPLASATAFGVDGELITIFDAIDRQLGLKLEAAKIPTPVLVVDSVNRKPSDNPPGVSAILGPPPPAAFEVASLRLTDPNAPEFRSPGPLPGGRFDVQNFSLKQLITLAWGPGGSQLTGEPAWLKSIRVDLTAKLPATYATREIVGVLDHIEEKPTDN